MDGYVVACESATNAVCVRGSLALWSLRRTGPSLLPAAISRGPPKPKSVVLFHRVNKQSIAVAEHQRTAAKHNGGG